MLVVLLAVTFELLMLTLPLNSVVPAKAIFKFPLSPQQNTGTLTATSGGNIGVFINGVALFENCVKKTPESALCQCNLAYNSLITNKYDASVKHYSEALKYDPTTVEAYNGRGQALLELGKIPEALDDFTKAIQAGIVTPKLFLNRAKCLVRLNRATEAIPDLNKSIELESKSAEAYYFRAQALDKAGKQPESLADYGKAIDLNPNYIEALVNRGQMLFKSQKYVLIHSDLFHAITKFLNAPVINERRLFLSYIQKCGKHQTKVISYLRNIEIVCAGSALNTALPATIIFAPAAAAWSMVSKANPPSTSIIMVGHIPLSVITFAETG